MTSQQSIKITSFSPPTIIQMNKLNDYERLLYHKLLHSTDTLYMEQTHITSMRPARGPLELFLSHFAVLFDYLTHVY